MFEDKSIDAVSIATPNHWQWNYGCGDVGNQGIHETDLCMWGLNVGLPEIITAGGGKFLFDDAKETPEVLATTYYYPKEKKIIEFEVRPWITNAENGAEADKYLTRPPRKPFEVPEEV